MRLYLQWRSLKFPTEGAEVTGPKNFYKTGGSKTYILKNFYTKTTHFPLLSEKFGRSVAPSRPLKASPMFIYTWYQWSKCMFSRLEFTWYHTCDLSKLHVIGIIN
ncbi:hypothetical protein Hanom_Chr12g01076581 [Helianthus anomalus]